LPSQLLLPLLLRRQHAAWHSLARPLLLSLLLLPLVLLVGRPQGPQLQLADPDSLDLLLLPAVLLLALAADLLQQQQQQQHLWLAAQVHGLLPLHLPFDLQKQQQQQQQCLLHDPELRLPGCHPQAAAVPVALWWHTPLPQPG
jgi:hypothetical protein